MLDSSREAVILLSRQPLRPISKTPWVRQTVEAVRWLKKLGMGIGSSIGMQTWDLITVAATSERLPLSLVVAAAGEEDYLSLCREAIRHYDLDTRLVTFVPLLQQKKTRRPQAVFEARDRMLVARADLLLPISLREGGTLSKLVAEAAQSGKTVDSRFQIAYEKRSDKLSYEISAADLRRELETEACGFVVHWTRSCHTAWPDEPPADYYRAVLDSDVYSRSAFATLKRILRTRQILASSRHMPGRARTVSFSALPPSALPPLMKWRARYHEMSFEPYGIGIRKDVATRMGIKPVIYYETAAGRSGIAESDLWRSQSSGRVTDWRLEEEYRHLGDLDLNEAPVDALLAFCHESEEAREMEKETGIRTVSFLP